MSQPQKGRMRPNTFPTPNEHVDLAMEMLTPEEYKVLNFAIRHTWGWHVDQKAISITTFTHGYGPYRGVGMSRSTVLKCLSELSRLEFLVPMGKADADGQVWAVGLDPNIDALELRYSEKKQKSQEIMSPVRAKKGKAKTAVYDTDRSVTQTDSGLSGRPTAVYGIDAIKDTTKDTTKDKLLAPAIADRADTTSPSHTSSLADEADDPAMFQKPTARQLSSRVENGRKRLTATTPMSSATAPSPSLKPKSPTAQNTTAPIPHSAPPLSPADAPVSVDDVERFSSKLEQDKGKKAAKRSEAQLANDALVEALRVAWFTAREKEPVALGRTDYSNYLKVARVLVEGGATTDLFFTYVQYWFKASVAGGWTLTINSLVNNGRIADFKSWYASRAKKAISRDSTSTQVSTTQTGSKRAYDRRSDPTYAHLYETPTEVKQAK
jgi:hypothetical protein